jgi:hypothetical protein
MRKVSKVGAAAAGLVLAGGAAAAAVTAPPEAADDELTRAQENAGVEVPAATEDHPTSDDHVGDDRPDEALDAADHAEGTHGAEVSAVAQDDFTIGREHGEAVSEVARGDHGPEATSSPVDAPNKGGTSTADGASEVGAGEAADQAALGAGNAGDHGQP